MDASALAALARASSRSRTSSARALVPASSSLRSPSNMSLLFLSVSWKEPNLVPYASSWSRSALLASASARLVRLSSTAPSSSPSMVLCASMSLPLACSSMSAFCASASHSACCCSRRVVPRATSASFCASSLLKASNWPIMSPSLPRSSSFSPSCLARSDACASSRVFTSPMASPNFLTSASRALASSSRMRRASSTASLASRCSPRHSSSRRARTTLALRSSAWALSRSRVTASSAVCPS
mmetsp:Transcript_22616/g.57532  ORF Transcript_22616/g.57532 Transcript_22616/m.57532 type:complete len:242 (+) Transcript_22616:528-1253(+)